MDRPEERGERTKVVGLFAEAYRLYLLTGIERQLRHAGFERVAGVDEVGRGCLAGPVVAAAVIPDPSCLIPGVDDSKHLLPADRERLAEAILESAIAWAVEEVSPAEIDRINILEATRLAMRRALAALAPSPSIAVIDAVSPGDLPFPHLPVIRGDLVSYAVACASILAKVTRDRSMVDLDRRYPQYGFAANKGYAAEAHRRALVEHGPTPIHRLTFRSVLPRLDDTPRTGDLLRSA